jgi:hypothetical protein
MTQRCFCRCETTEGRQFGYCKDYESEVVPLPQEAIDSLLKATAAAGTCAAAPDPASHMAALPSTKSKSANKLDALLTLGVKSRAGKVSKFSKKK